MATVLYNLIKNICIKLYNNTYKVIIIIIIIIQTYYNMIVFSNYC